MCPYVDGYRDRVVATFARAGYECVAVRNSRLCRQPLLRADPASTTSSACCATSPRSRPQAIVTYCTNFPAAPVVAEMEEELGIPIYDSVTMAVWDALRLAGVPTAPGRAWGRVFER